MATYEIAEAEEKLEALIEAAERGEEVLIARDGKAVARMIKPVQEKTHIQFGTLKGKIWIADDFDAPLPPDLQAEFEADL
ncbi:MAG: hypothetical protein P4L03_00260 [Terracidiphilus sp.]|nr:hypothetical protein [Terracidiphilus sp.]